MALSTCLQYLRDYVAIPSVNPMGRSDFPEGIAGESRYADHVRHQLVALGLDAVCIGAPDRQSVIAEVRVPGARDTVMVASHLDTVPVDGMEIDPFDPRIENGRLYGRGSCDTKSGMAALVAALERVLARGSLRRNVIVVGEADEELGSRGVVDVLEHLGTARPDWVLATEPTDMRVVTHHKGIALARLAAHGRACHSSDPAAGQNAIYALARAALAIEDLCRKLESRRDPLLGHGTMSVGKIGGGAAPNIVPDAAWLITDRRLLPGETGEQVRKEIQTALDTHGVRDVEIEFCRVEKGALGIPRDHAAVRTCQAALAKAGLSAEPSTAAFGTDAGVLFAEHGLPGVVLGPGSITLAHTSRESVPVREVEQMVDVLTALFESES
jgi:acetylornithine deacetylase/succinyl-diaminopimelate desuccinylase-like protein